MFTSNIYSISVTEIKRNLEVKLQGLQAAGKAKGSGEPEPFGVQD
jgi:hypothetical protein